MNPPFRRILILSVVLALAAGPAFPWKFASMADSRGSTNGVNVATLSTIVSRVNAENVDLVIFQGDAVTGSSSDSTLSSQMDTWLVEMNKLNCPWYYTVGNHEVQTSTAEENVLRGKVIQTESGPDGYKEFVFSFDYQNARFVFLNSNHYGEAHHVQRSWLSSDFAGTTQPHIFVMAHEPAYPKGPHIGSSLDAYPSERDDFWNIMSNAGVRMYFCGHEHLYARSQHGTVMQVINGTCGAPVASGYPGTTAEYHYVVVTVEDDLVHCEAKTDDGTVIDTWDYAIGPSPSVGSLKGLPDDTPVFLTGKTVTAGNDQFSSILYVEDEDHASGIMVCDSPITVQEDDGADVFGTMYTYNGERLIMAQSVSQRAALYEVRPAGMITRSLGGGSLNEYTPGVTGGTGLQNTGLLVTTWGEVTAVNQDWNFFYVDDGSGRQDGSGYDGVRVDFNFAQTIPPFPDVDDYVVVTGISSRAEDGSNIIPTVCPRKEEDIATYP